MRKITLTTILMLLMLSGAVLLPAIETDQAQELLTTLDEMKNFDETDLSARMTMIVEDPEAAVEKNVVQQFRRDKDNTFLMLFQEPAVKKGQGYLQVDENLWFYDPESRQFSHTSMNDRFSDSEANNSDFQRASLAEDYKVVKTGEGSLGKYQADILYLEATGNEVTYPSRTIWVAKEVPLILKTADYSAGGRLLRTSYYPSYARVGENSYLASTMIFVDELIPGKKTTITLTDISTRTIPDSVFTKAYVERVNN